MTVELGKRWGQLGLALWVVQIALGAAFVVSGAMKLFTIDRYKKMAESRSPQRGLGNSKGFLTFIGACELLGGVGVILPVALVMVPILTSLAAVGLDIIMAGATIFT